MIFSAILSFLGGSVFRMIFGEVSAFLTKWQDNKHELDLMDRQAQLEDARSKRMMEAAQQQATLNIKTIEVQGEQDIARLETQGWANAVSEAFKPTGIFFVDLWNGVIRPCAATIALALWVLKLMAQGWKMDEFDVGLVSVILGFFFADRSMRKNGK